MSVEHYKVFSPEWMKNTVTSMLEARASICIACVADLACIFSTRKFALCFNTNPGFYLAKVKFEIQNYAPGYY